MKNKGAKQKSKKKGNENAFGCNLTEHLQNTGHDVPQVLKTCAEFIEKHGVVDGIYRLSGVTSNIQRLRQEFSSESCPDLTKEVYLQDIHCVGSLCKLYFRELPDPLLTYELYKKFTDTVTVQKHHEKLQHIQNVIKELPVSHFRTLEYLTKHLAHLATLSPQTNMHTRNLALVWAPNLLRCKDIEVLSCNGDIAFQEVRVQQSVVEFILNHTEQIFNNGAVQIELKEGLSVVCGEKYATLPISGQGGPMKLMSLEEAQARSLSPNHPARRERQRENSLPDTSTATLYHTVIDMSDSKRKFSGKSKKWKSIFNLGKSVTDTKGKLSRNGSVLMREQNTSEKATIRPARSMDSLRSLPTEEEKANCISGEGANGFFIAGMKSRTLGSESLFDLNEKDQKWEFDLKKLGRAIGGGSPGVKRRGSPGASEPLPKVLPEQLKVFKGDDLSGCQPTSPKNRRMLYSGSSHCSSSRPSFPGSLFPLESSPRHQRKALNISEPFAVSVPLRVSAVISSNSTPCRAPGKDKSSAGTAMKPSKEYSQSELSDSSGSSGYKENTFGESSVGSQHSIYSNSSGPPLEMEDRPAEVKCKEEPNSKSMPKGSVSEGEIKKYNRELEGSQSIISQILISNIADKEKEQSSGKQLDNQLAHHEPRVLTEMERESSHGRKELWSDLHAELKITEPEIDLLEEELQPVFCSTKNICDDVRPKAALQSERRSSLPTYSLLHKGKPFMCAKPHTIDDFAAMTGENPEVLHPSGKLISIDRRFDFIVNADKINPLPQSPNLSYKLENKLMQIYPKADTENSLTMTLWPQLPPHTETNVPVAPQNPQTVIIPKQTEDIILDMTKPGAKKGSVGEHIIQDGVKKVVQGVGKRDWPAELTGDIERLSICLEASPHNLKLTTKEDEDRCGEKIEELDLVEPWDDFSSNKQWVTSPLHSPTLKELFEKLEVSPSCHVEKHVNSKEENTSPLSVADKEINRLGTSWCTELLTGSISQTNSGKTETETLQIQPKFSKMSNDTPRSHRGTLPAIRIKDTTSSSQTFRRQMSHSEASHVEKTEENRFSKTRPYSLNLDLGHRCIRDISNQQNHNSLEFSSTQRGELNPSELMSTSLSLELELFLNDRQAPMRRNSAPVSVSSVRTAFLIKTCKAKAVPVITPKVQYSHIPYSRNDKSSDGAKRQGTELTKAKIEKVENVPLFQPIRILKEKLENKEPVPKTQRQPITDKATETCKIATTSDLPVLRRKHTSNIDPFVDLPKPDRPTLLQRPSFRSRQRPQSLILFSPPFPIMDCPTLGDDGKLLFSTIKRPTETLASEVFSKEMAENIRTPEGVTFRSKMTIPKSGQRLETSTSCFYQPQRRSMIFDNRSHRQIE